MKKVAYSDQNWLLFIGLDSDHLFLQQSTVKWARALSARNLKVVG